MRTLLGISVTTSLFLALPLAGSLAVAACSSSSSPTTPVGSEDSGVAADSGPTTTGNVDASTNTTPDSSTTTADTGSPVTDSGSKADGNTGDAACVFPSSGPTSSATCNTCLAMSCCSPVVTCLDDPACLSFNNCLANCQQGELPDDGGAYDAAAGSSQLTACETTCATGVSTTVQNEQQAQTACFNTGGPCVTQCQ